MYYDQRNESVRQLLRDYASSPSLRHLRDPGVIERLAVRIVKRLDEVGSVWKKWIGAREQILGDALECWIPTADMLDFLNSLPGPALTTTDLEQRMRTMVDKEYIGVPDDDLRDECLEIYRAERSAGTEMPAIIGRLSEYVVQQWPRLQEARRHERERQLTEARENRERRLFSAADCPWTQVRGSKCFYCRKNGRTFRVRPLPDKTWEMHRVDEVDDGEGGQLIGHYRSRGDASKVVSKTALEDDSRWVR